MGGVRWAARLSSQRLLPDNYSMVNGSDANQGARHDGLQPCCDEAQRRVRGGRFSALALRIPCGRGGLGVLTAIRRAMYKQIDIYTAHDETGHL